MDNQRDDLRFSTMWLAVLRTLVGLTWIYSVSHKLSGDFIDRRVLELLTIYASGAHSSDPCGCFPSTPFFPWYAGFLQNVVIPSYKIFGWLVLFGELAAAIFLLLGLLTNIGAVISIFMNVNYYLAAGWLSSSDAVLNLLMIALGAIILLSREAKSFSLDEKLATRFPWSKRWLMGE